MLSYIIINKLFAFTGGKEPFQQNESKIAKIQCKRDFEMLLIVFALTKHIIVAGFCKVSVCVSEKFPFHGWSTSSLWLTIFFMLAAFGLTANRASL